MYSNLIRSSFERATNPKIEDSNLYTTEGAKKADKKRGVLAVCGHGLWKNNLRSASPNLFERHDAHIHAYAVVSEQQKLL